jgi:hypothetical protein
MWPVIVDGTIVLAAVTIVALVAIATSAATGDSSGGAVRGGRG